ncbi:polyketide synthase dehydratase domain-containing protein, partial [candidate division KSB1 bacterium]|nr:polyketide synthase dehydratase domain-containing protein [candidate division KSB1 bacterium]
MTAEPIAGDFLDAGYWGRNVRATVRFAEGIARLLQDDFRAFVEISPHPVIAGAISQCAHDRQKEAVVVSSLRRGQEDRAMLLAALGTLYVHGYEVNWKALHAAAGKVVALPGYPWQHQRYWLEARKPSGRRTSAQRSGSPVRAVQPLLGERVFSPLPIFEAVFNFAELPFLEDHRVAGAGIVPAAVYLEMVRAAAAEVLGLVLTPQPADSYSFQIFSLAGAAQSPAHAWLLHAAGSIAAVDDAKSARTESLAPADLQTRLAESLSGEAFYEKLRAQDFHFGPRFRGLRQLWLGKEEALGRVELPEALSPETGNYFIHPALLDAGLQTLAALLPDTGPLPEPVLMVNLGRFQMLRRPGALLWSHAVLRPEDSQTAGVLHGEVHLYSETGELIAAAENLLLKRVPRGLLRREPPAFKSNWLYEMSWQLMPPSQPPPAEETPAPVISPAEIMTSLRPAVAETAAQHGLTQFADL